MAAYTQDEVNSIRDFESRMRLKIMDMIQGQDGYWEEGGHVEDTQEDLEEKYNPSRK